MQNMTADQINKWKSEALLTTTDIISSFHDEVFKDKEKFYEAMRLKINNITSIETQKIMTKLISSKKQNDLRWEIFWAKKEQEDFLWKVKDIEITESDPNAKIQKLSKILDSEITRERVQSFILSTKKIKRNPDTHLTVEKQNKLQENILVYENSTVWEALWKIDQSTHNFVIMIDKNWKFLWVYTKYDIDWFSRNKKLNDPNVATKKLDKDAITGSEHITDSEALEKLKIYGLTGLPILDENNVLAWILWIKNLNVHKTRNTCVLGLTRLNLNQFISSNELLSLV